MPEMASGGEPSTSATPDDIEEPVTWCDQCRGFQFDDANWGGHEVTNPNTGERFVQFEFDSSQLLFADWMLPDEFPHLPNLTAAMDKGCGFCAFLWATLRSSEFVLAVEHENQTSRKKNCDRLEFYLMCCYDFAEKEPGGQKCLKGFKFLFRPRDRAGFLLIECPVQRSPIPDPCTAWLGLDEHVEELPSDPLGGQFSDWFSSCLSDCVGRDSHKPHSLDGGSQHRWLPTRLVEICDSTSLRLVHGSDILEQTPHEDDLPHYTALSYCWGTSKDAASQLKVTTRNQSSLASGFVCSETPKVLQDAVTVTRALGVRYIWIDALCILQDSISDWEAESSQMATVYGSAFLTICSLTSSCHISFLKQDYRQVRVEFQSSLDPRISGTYTISHKNRFVISSRSLPSDSQSNDRVPFNRWEHRGWTFQEALMSRHLLMFSPPHKFFICDTAANVQGQGRVDNFLRMDLSLDTAGLYIDWLIVASYYSWRQLTVAQDALPAISGLARRFAEKLDDGVGSIRYVAGIWEPDSIHGLTWYLSPGSPIPAALGELLSRLENPEPYIAPSWSWAAHHQVCFYRNARYDLKQGKWSRVAFSEIKPEGKDAFGRLRPGGQLNVTGRTYNFCFDETSTVEKEDEVFNAFAVSLVRIKSSENPLRCCLDWDPDSLSHTPEQFTLVALAEASEGQDAVGQRANGPSKKTLVGLVLLASKKQPEFFHRVGLWEWTCSTGDFENAFMPAMAISVI